MGKTHSTSGVTVALAYVALGLPLAPSGVTGTVAFATVTAGTALWPDWDHPSATAANSWGPASRLVSRLVVSVCGPHRHGAHSVFTAAALGLGAGAAAGLAAVLPGTFGLVASLLPTLLVFLASSLAIGVLWRSRGPANEALGAALAAAFYLGEAGTAWLGVAVFLGCLAHIAGDALTDAPMKMLWPVSNRMVPSLGLFTTQHAGERLFYAGLVAANAALLVAVSGYWPQAAGLAEDSWPYVADAATRLTGVGA